MIHALSGTLGERGDAYLVVDVGGVGFKVFGTPRLLARFHEPGEKVRLYTYLSVKEDALDLYGFGSKDERLFFELLISVNGVGPKSALAVLGVADLGELAAAIKENRPDLLARASGIGRKTAERIVLELKGKIESAGAARVVAAMDTDADLIEALVGLGYRRDEARSALGHVGKEARGAEARLKAALKVLAAGRKK